MNSFFSQDELESLGFDYVGRNVKISKKCSIYNPSKIRIGDNTRIDDYCVISAGNEGISIGKNVHIAVYCSLIGNGEILLEDYVGLSSRVSIYSSNDDYSGEFMTNPTVSKEFTNVTSGKVILKKHSIIGSGAVLLPNIILEEGVCIGALSLVNRSCESFKIYSGVPIKNIKRRSTNLLEIEKKLSKHECDGL